MDKPKNPTTLGSETDCLIKRILALVLIHSQKMADLIQQADQKLLEAIILYRKGVQKLSDEGQYVKAADVLRNGGILESAKRRLDPTFDPTADRETFNWILMMADCCEADGVVDKRKLLRWHMNHGNYAEAIELMNELEMVGGMDLALCQLASNISVTLPADEHERSFIERIQTAILEKNTDQFADLCFEYDDLLNEVRAGVLLTLKYRSK